MRPDLPAAFRSTPIAHRGYHDRAAGRIENSTAAIRAAVSAGYGIEIDLQPSADGQAMVFHDETLDRLTAQTGPVAARTAAELSAIVLSGGGEGIPTLTDVLALIDGRVPLLIEIKDQSLSLSATDVRLEAATAAALRGYAGPVAVMSFNPACIAHLARLAQEVPRGLTTCAFEPADWQPATPDTCARLRDIPDYHDLGCSFVSHQATDLGRPRVADLAGQGAAILCWTIRSVAAEAEARKIAHNITFEAYPAALSATAQA